MPDHPSEQVVADAIERRRLELGLSIGDMERRAGVSAPTIAPLRRGERRRYADATKFGLAAALRWPRDAIDRLFAGETPDETWEASSGDGIAVLEAIDADPALDDHGRRSLRAVYLALAKHRQ